MVGSGVGMAQGAALQIAKEGSWRRTSAVRGKDIPVCPRVPSSVACTLSIKKGPGSQGSSEQSQDPHLCSWLVTTSLSGWRGRREQCFHLGATLS